MAGNTEPRSDGKQPCAASSRGRTDGTSHHDTWADHYEGNGSMVDTCVGSASTCRDLESWAYLDTQGDDGAMVPDGGLPESVRLPYFSNSASWSLSCLLWISFCQGVCCTVSWTQFDLPEIPTIAGMTLLMI